MNDNEDDLSRAELLAEMARLSEPELRYVRLFVKAMKAGRIELRNYIVRRSHRELARAERQAHH